MSYNFGNLNTMIFCCKSDNYCCGMTSKAIVVTLLLVFCLISNGQVSANKINRKIWYRTSQKTYVDNENLILKFTIVYHNFMIRGVEWSETVSLGVPLDLIRKKQAIVIESSPDLIATYWLNGPLEFGKEPPLTGTLEFTDLKNQEVQIQLHYMSFHLRNDSQEMVTVNYKVDLP
jgi:hypothetical protein